MNIRLSPNQSFAASWPAVEADLDRMFRAKYAEIEPVAPIQKRVRVSIPMMRNVRAERLVRLRVGCAATLYVNDPTSVIRLASQLSNGKWIARRKGKSTWIVERIA